MNYKPTTTLLLGSFLLAMSAALAAEPSPENWPQWRGPTRNAKVAGGAQWPSSLDGLTERWRVSLQPSYSGPIVWNDRIFVTETKDRRTEIVRALDRNTGKEIWQASWSGALSVPFFAKANGDWIRSTPACDGESLYVAGIRDVLVCLDAASGAERWRFDFPKQTGSSVPSFGFVSSPFILGEFVYVQAGGGFAKVNKKSGELLWKILDDGGGMNSSFSSPRLATIADTPQLLVQMRQELVGVSPDDGKVLWRQKVPLFRGMNILTPTVFGDGIFTSTYKNRSFLFNVEKRGDTFSVSESWRSSAQGYMSSPVVIGEYAYLHLGNGRFCCIDLKSGEEIWRTKAFGKYWSMAARENRILALDERGELLLIDADPGEFRLLDRKKVSDRECWAHVAVSGQNVLVRDLGGLTLFDWWNAESKKTD